MAKLIALLATFALCALLANASIYRTTVELDEDVETNQWGAQGRCQREFQQQQQLWGCKQFIRHRIQRGGRGYIAATADDFELVAVADENDNDIYGENQMRPALRQCCNELRQVDCMCVCPVLRKATRQVMLQGQQHGPLKVRQMYQTARNLPNICNIPVGQCQFKAVPY